MKFSKLTRTSRLNEASSFAKSATNFLKLELKDSSLVCILQLRYGLLNS